MRQALFTAFAAAALMLLGACHSRHREEDAREEASKVSAEGKAQEGKISVKAPGFDLTFSLPKEMAQEARADKNSRILYPGSTIAGVAVAAGKGGDHGGDSEVEMRFRSADPVDRVLAWYRDPARASGFRLRSVGREGGVVEIAGIQNSDKHPFKVRLETQGGGGTEGRLTIHHTD